MVDQFGPDKQKHHLRMVIPYLNWKLPIHPEYLGE
jgi:hypothetical protein